MTSKDAAAPMHRLSWATLLLPLSCNALWDIEQLPRGGTTPELLSGSFAHYSSSCSACLQEQCTAELTECATDAACAAFSTCRWQQDRSPGGELRCGTEYGTSSEDPLAPARRLRNCWENACIDACELGTDASCVRSYFYPAPDASGSITVTQTLEELTGAPLCAATVRFCGPLVDSAECASSYDQMGITDCDGVARADLPVSSDGRRGWSGYRQVLHDSLFPLRLQTNQLIPLSRFMSQQVPSNADVLGLAALSGADTARGSVLFQVFDCSHTPAEGVRIEIEPQLPERPVTDERTLLGYTPDRNERFPLQTEGTRARGGGSGAILNLLPNEWMWVRARHASTSDIIAEVLVRTHPGELLLLELHPDPQ